MNCFIVAVRGAALAVCAISLASFPMRASATSCDARAIKARSISDSAKFVLNSADYVGLGRVKAVPSALSTQQQHVHLNYTAKGTMREFLMSPYRLNGARRIDDLVRWFGWKDNSDHLIALIKTSDGFAAPACLVALIAAKPQAELVNAIKALTANRNDTVVYNK